MAAPHYHPLEYTKGKRNNCDICGSRGNAEFGCRACNYDECIDCFPRSKSSMRTPTSFSHEHELEGSFAPYPRGGAICNVCRSNVERGVMVYHCGICHWDECRGCFAKTNSREAASSSAYASGAASHDRSAAAASASRSVDTSGRVWNFDSYDWPPVDWDEDNPDTTRFTTGSSARRFESGACRDVQMGYDRATGQNVVVKQFKPSFLTQAESRKSPAIWKEDLKVSRDAQHYAAKFMGL